MQSGKRWGVVAFGTLLTAGVAIPLFGQKPNFGDMDKNQAREITQLIEQGQIGLPEAIKLAETKANGKALECFAQLELGSPEVGQHPTNMKGQEAEKGQPGAMNKPTANNNEVKRVVYHVQVFANGDLATYMVDAKTKEVIGLGERFKQTSDRPLIDREKP